MKGGARQAARAVMTPEQWAAVGLQRQQGATHPALRAPPVVLQRLHQAVRVEDAASTRDKGECTGRLTPSWVHRSGSRQTEPLRDPALTGHILAANTTRPWRCRRRGR